MTYIATESADPANLPMAKEMLEALTVAYPKHSWKVRIDGGIVFITCLEIAWRKPIGMARKFKDMAHDAMARKREVIRAAGELLERAHLKRGTKEEGAAAKVLEGGEEFKWSPSPWLH